MKAFFPCQIPQECFSYSCSLQLHSWHSLRGPLLCLVFFSPPFIPGPSSSWCLLFLPFSSDSCSLLLTTSPWHFTLYEARGLEALSFTSIASLLKAPYWSSVPRWLFCLVSWWPFRLIFLRSLFPHSLNQSFSLPATSGRTFKPDARHCLCSHIWFPVLQLLPQQEEIPWKQSLLKVRLDPWSVPRHEWSWLVCCANSRLLLLVLQQFVYRGN